MSLKFLILGDVMAGENIGHYGRGIRSKFTNNYSQLVRNNIAESLFSNIDFVFYNFEYSLIDKKIGFEKLEDSIYTAAIDSLAIFPGHLLKIVNIANNHFSQHGSHRALYTKETLKKNGFLIVGENTEPSVINNPSQNIKIWGASLVVDRKYCGEYFYSSYKNLLSDLKLPVKSTNEKWLISLHWGDEYISLPSAEQINLGHQLVDAGFDLIIGHHPHVIQPIEKYNNKYIIYSLGNFIFDQDFSFRTQKGLALQIKINDNIVIQNIVKTFQKKHQVALIRKTSSNFKNQRASKFYKPLLKIIRAYYRLLMKFELFLHWSKVNKQTKQYFKNRITL